MKYLLLASMLFLSGCGLQDMYNDVFTDDNKSAIVWKGHRALCTEKPDDYFCETRPSTGDIKPLWLDVKEAVLILGSNFIYTSDIDDEWNYNLTINETLREDCDGNALTLAYHLLEEMVVDRKHIVLAAKYYPDEDSYHMFVAVNTIDRGWAWFDYDFSGDPLPDINWHMLMTDVGVNKWIKGNIQ